MGLGRIHKGVIEDYKGVLFYITLNVSCIYFLNKKHEVRKKQTHNRIQLRIRFLVTLDPYQKTPKIINVFLNFFFLVK